MKEDAKKLGLKYFLLWKEDYVKWLYFNDLKHNLVNMRNYWNKHCIYKGA